MQDAWPSPAVCKILLGKVKGDGDPVVTALWRGMADPARCNSWGELHESLFLPEEGSKSGSEEQRFLMSLLPPYLLESKRFLSRFQGGGSPSTSTKSVYPILVAVTQSLFQASPPLTQTFHLEWSGTRTFYKT